MKRIRGRCSDACALARAALACLVVLVSAGCSDQPVQPELRGGEVAPAPAPAPAPLPQLVLQPDGLFCTESGATLSSGALFRICVNPATWNRDLVVFIPGYHDPLKAPTLPDDFSDTPVSLLFTALGYGFATTSFRGSGLMETDTWIGGDLLELVSAAKTLLYNTTGRTTRFVYQTGGSQGGLGTVKAVEQYPNVFSGGLAGCGPIGSYRRQVAYVADFRAIFDYYFDDPVIAEWPVWKQDLSAGDPGYVDPTSWHDAELAAGAALDDPGNADRIRQVLAVTHAPTDPAVPATIKGTSLGLLWYSFRGSNDAIAKLGGSPFDNTNRRYSGSLDDEALNAGVERFAFTADPTKLAKLETSARLRRPLVTIHTTGDPIVPVWQQSLYRSRLDFFSKFLHTPITISRYGHCNFTDAEVLGAFAVLVLEVTGYNLIVPNSVLPKPQAQAEFFRIARAHGANPVMAHRSRG